MSSLRELKTKAHRLSPVVTIGPKGLTDNVLLALEETLEHHELIKIKIALPRDERKIMLSDILTHTQATLVQAIGQTASLYRQRKK